MHFIKPHPKSCLSIWRQQKKERSFKGKQVIACFISDEGIRGVGGHHKFLSTAWGLSGCPHFVVASIYPSSALFSTTVFQRGALHVNISPFKCVIYEEGPRTESWSHVLIAFTCCTAVSQLPEVSLIFTAVFLRSEDKCLVCAGLMCTPPELSARGGSRIF